MKTINDIARITGVSTSTVSRVLNNHPSVSPRTRTKVIEVIKKCDYRPNAIARSLTTKKSYTIGMFGAIFPETNYVFHLNNDFFKDIIYGFEVVLGEKGYDLLYFTNVNLRDLSFTDKCRNRNVDGAIFLGFSKDTPNLADFLKEEIPAVFIDTNITAKRVSYVTSTNVLGAGQAVNYLYQLGHQKIGFIRGIKGQSTAQERIKGFKQALVEKGLRYNQDWVISGSYSREHGYWAMNKILENKSIPTAIFCQDLIAFGAYKAVKEHGLKIPEDISIIGFDDIDMCSYVNPPLTTIRQDRYRMGRAVGTLLLDIIDFNDDISPIRVPTEIVERDSCRSL